MKRGHMAHSYDLWPVANPIWNAMLAKVDAIADIKKSRIDMRLALGHAPALDSALESPNASNF